MTVSPPHQAGGGLQHNTTKGQTQSTTPRVCFRCKGEKHIKLGVTGMDKVNHPDTKCQLCFQMGHGAPRCKKLAGARHRVTMCQLCNQPEHAVDQCPQLNGMGLCINPDYSELRTDFTLQHSFMYLN